MFSEEKLFVRTRSVPTAAAMWLLTGVAPRVLRRTGGDTPVFEWDPQYEPKLQEYIKAKDAVDRLTKGRSAQS